MRTIVISDTHLTAAFNPRKFAFLRSIIEPAERVIINGDFWDSYITSFDRFVRSPWNQLFPLLKNRKAIYLHGNHDPQETSDERVDHFSIEQHNAITFPLSPRRCRGEGDELMIQHGQRIVPHADARVARLARIPVLSLIGASGEWALTNLFGRTYLQLHRRDNQAMKAWAASHLKPNQILVTGHNHLAEIDLGHRYICTGFIRYGWASYLAIEDGKLELIHARY